MHGMDGGALPLHLVPRAPRRAAGACPEPDWRAVPPLSPLVLTEDGAAPAQPTTVRACWDDAALYVRFDCADRDAWGAYRRHDDPIYEEEVVEVFLAAGEADPIDYFEFEVSPTGIAFDAAVHNPTSRRAEMRIGREWDCPGLRWQAGRAGQADDWWATLAIPWAAVSPAPAAPPRRWRANFYRIERPRDGTSPEFSAWSPTLGRPADFHRPARFGRLELG
jgi:cellulose/xylan binding protein with CBM9 domain